MTHPKDTPASSSSSSAAARARARARASTEDDGEAGRRTPRWHWVGADPDDTSPDADFRRAVAAQARKIMLARGADVADVPPLERTVPRARDPWASAGQGAPGGPEAGAPARSGHGVSASTDGDDSGTGTGSATVTGPATQPPDYFDIRATASFAIATAFRAVRSAVAVADTATGSMPAGLTLLAIARSSRGVTLDRLMKNGDLPQSTVSTIVARLVEHGLVARRRHPADRRRWVYRATTVGLQEAERLAVIWRHLDDRLAGALSVTECEELARLLRRAEAVLKR